MVLNHLKKMRFLITSDKKSDLLQKDNWQDALDDSNLPSDKPSSKPKTIKTSSKQKTTKPTAAPVEAKKESKQTVSSKELPPLAENDAANFDELYGADTQQNVEAKKESKPTAAPVEAKKESKPTAAPVEAKKESKPTAAPVEAKKESKPTAAPVEAKKESKTKKQKNPKSSKQAAPTLPPTGTIPLSTMSAVTEPEHSAKIHTGGFKEDIPLSAQSTPKIQYAPPSEKWKKEREEARKKQKNNIALPSTIPSSVLYPPPPKDQNYSPSGPVSFLNNKKEDQPIFLPTNMHEHLDSEALEQWKKGFANKIQNHAKLSANDKKTILNRFHQLYGKPIQENESKQKDSFKQKFKNFISNWKTKQSKPKPAASKPEVDMAKRKFLGLGSKPLINKSLTKAAVDWDNLGIDLDDKDLPSDKPATQSVAQTITNPTTPASVQSKAKKPVVRQYVERNLNEPDPQISATPSSVQLEGREFRLNYKDQHPKNMLQHLENRMKTKGNDAPSVRQRVLTGVGGDIIKFVSEFPEHTQDVLGTVNTFLNSSPGSSTKQSGDAANHPTVTKLQEMLNAANQDKIEQTPLSNFKSHIYDRIKKEREAMKAAPGIQMQSRSHIHGPGNSGTSTIEFDDAQDSDPESRTKALWGAMVGEDKSGLSRVVADIFRESFGLKTDQQTQDSTASEKNLMGLKTGQPRSHLHNPHSSVATQFTPPESPDLFTSAETITTPSEEPIPVGSTRSFKDIVNISPQYYREYIKEAGARSDNREDYIRFKRRHAGLKEKLKEFTETNEDPQNEGGK